MISGVGSVAILVNDAKKSVEWYREKLGFEVVEGIECAMWHGTGSEGHAVSIRPKGSDVPLLHLCEKCEDWGDEKPGGRTGIWLNCGEITLRRKDTGKVFPSSNPANVEKTYRE